MQHEFTIYLDAMGIKEYNSFLSFHTKDKEEVEKFFIQILEIEFLSKKIEYQDAGNITIYHFNVTKQKEDEVKSLFDSGLNHQIINEVPISYN